MGIVRGAAGLAAGGAIMWGGLQATGDFMNNAMKHENVPASQWTAGNKLKTMLESDFEFIKKIGEAGCDNIPILNDFLCDGKMPSADINDSALLAQGSFLGGLLGGAAVAGLGFYRFNRGALDAANRQYDKSLAKINDRNV
ncbi:MAG: hypothetical protein WBO35_06575 [Candidatus Saccharimonadales bacterium]